MLKPEFESRMVCNGIVDYELLQINQTGLREAIRCKWPDTLNVVN